VIVSPYNEFRGWRRLESLVARALAAVPRVEYYTREDHEAGNAFLAGIGVTPILVPNLHAKLYLSETAAVVSSMNLLRSSEERSLEIALQTESDSEHRDLYDFYEKYLLRYKQNPVQTERPSLPESVGDIYDAIAYILDERLSEAGHPSMRVDYSRRRGDIRYRVGRRDVDVSWDFTGGRLWIVARMILSGALYEFLRVSLRTEAFSDDLSVELEDPGAGYYSYFQAAYSMPERKLVHCSRLQIEHAARAIAGAIFTVVDAMLGAEDTAIVKEVRSPQR
jgi:hypothetical protein